MAAIVNDNITRYLTGESLLYLETKINCRETKESSFAFSPDHDSSSARKLHGPPNYDHTHTHTHTAI